MSQKTDLEGDIQLGEQADMQTRREFLVGVKNWSWAVVLGAVAAGLAIGAPEASAGWANRRGGGGWANRSGGAWGNRSVSTWGNGGGTWANRRGLGGWINNR